MLAAGSFACLTLLSAACVFLQKRCAPLAVVAVVAGTAAAAYIMWRLQRFTSRQARRAGLVGGAPTPDAGIGSTRPCPSESTRGLVNGGTNTCFLNSILQALFHVPVLRDAIYKSSEDVAHAIWVGAPPEIKQKNETSITTSRILYDTLKLFFAEDHLQPLAPFRVRELAKTFGFTEGGQADAAEFLNALVNSCSPLQGALEAYLAKQGRCPLCPAADAWRQLGERDVVATWELEVRSDDGWHAKSVHDAFDRFLTAERLTDTNRSDCHICKPRVKTPTIDSIRHTMIGFPPCLVVTLKLFGYSNFQDQRFKINADVQPSLTLTFESATYALKAFVVHVGGSALAGHYISYVLHNGGWWRKDDDRVTYVLATELEQLTPYISFYERIEGAAPSAPQQTPPATPSANSTAAAVDDSSCPNTDASSQTCLGEPPRVVSSIPSLGTSSSGEPRPPRVVLAQSSAPGIAPGSTRFAAEGFAANNQRRSWAPLRSATSAASASTSNTTPGLPNTTPLTDEQRTNIESNRQLALSRLENSVQAPVPLVAHRRSLVEPPEHESLATSHHVHAWDMIFQNVGKYAGNKWTLAQVYHIDEPYVRAATSWQAGPKIQQFLVAVDQAAQAAQTGPEGANGERCVPEHSSLLSHTLTDASRMDLSKFGKYLGKNFTLAQVHAIDPEHVAWIANHPSWTNEHTQRACKRFLTAGLEAGTFETTRLGVVLKNSQHPVVNGAPASDAPNQVDANTINTPATQTGHATPNEATTSSAHSAKAQESAAASSSSLPMAATVAEDLIKHAHALHQAASALKLHPDTDAVAQLVGVLKGQNTAQVQTLSRLQNLHRVGGAAAAMEFLNDRSGNLFKPKDKSGRPARGNNTNKSTNIHHGRGRHRDMPDHFPRWAVKNGLVTSPKDAPQYWRETLDREAKKSWVNTYGNGKSRGMQAPKGMKEIAQASAPSNIQGDVGIRSHAHIWRMRQTCAGVR